MTVPRPANDLQLLPKPRVRSAPGSTAIDFGAGLTGTIVIDLEDRSAHPSKRYDWEIRSIRRQREPILFGHCYSWDSAMLALWCRAGRARPLPAIGLTELELHRAVRRVQTGDARATAKVLRGLLRDRTGFGWSVCCGRGTSSEYVTIAAKPARRSRSGAMTPQDAAILAGVLDLASVNPRGVTISPDGDARALTVRALAGAPLAPELEAVAS